MFCRINPQAKNKKDSILFQDLSKRFPGNREQNLEIWGIATSKEFISTYGDSLIFDENNEPTLDSLYKFLNINELENTASKLRKYNEEISRNMPASHYDVVKRAVEFNDEHSDAIAVIRELNHSRSTIEVRALDDNSAMEKKKMKSQLDVVKQIDEFLHSLGLNVNWLDSEMFNSGENGLMLPDKLTNAVNDLYGVINVKNNPEGMKAVSEEFAHLVVEMLRVNNQQLVSRLEDLVAKHPEIGEKILGDEYTSVQEYYETKGRPDLFNREILGRVLQNHINKVGVPATLSNTPIWKRMIDAIARLFEAIRNKITGNNIKYLENAIGRAYNDVVTPGYITNDLIRKTAVIGDRMANAAKSISQLQKITDKISKTSTKYVSSTKRFAAEQEMKLRTGFEGASIIFSRARREGNDKAKFLKGITTYLELVQKSLETIFKNLKNIQFNEAALDFYTIQKYSNILMEASDFMDSFPDVIHDIRVLSQDMYEESNPDMKLNDEEKTGIGNALSNIVALQAQIEPYYVETRKRVVHDFLLPHFANGAEYVTIPFGVHKDEQISLFQLMDTVMFGDVNFFNRWLINMANIDELFNGCVAHAMDAYDEDIRQRVNNYAIQIKALHENYRRKTGKNDTKFMFEINPDTKLPVGYYISEYDHLKYEKDKKAYREKLISEGKRGESLTFEMSQWVAEHTKWVTRKHDYTFVDNEGKSHTVTKIRKDRVPSDKYYKSDKLDKLDAAQLEYYTEFMRLKDEFDFMLPGSKVSKYKCIQKMICDSAEGILNSTSIKNKVVGAFKIFKTNNFEYSENDEHDIFGKTQRDRGFFKNLRKLWAKQEELSIKKMATKFNGEEYHHVPLLYVNELEDLGKLSLDASASLFSYAMSSVNFSQLHRLTDVMELVSQVSSARKLSKSSYSTKVIDPDSSRINPQESMVSNKNSKVDEMLKSFIQMRVYKLYKFDGFASKGIDFLMKYTNVATLGFNMFTGIANINIGKYQAFIEAVGGEYFTFKDLLAAEGKYAKMLAEGVKDTGLERTTNKLDLITQLFNIGTNYESIMRGTHFFEPGALKFGSKVINPSVFMEMGEHWIQHTGALAMLNAYKMCLVDKDGNIIKKSNLLDLLEVKEITRGGKVVGARLALPDNARKLTVIEGNKRTGVEQQDIVGDKFDLSAKSKDLSDLSLAILNVNQHMHGIYNRNDATDLKRTALGRALFQFRNHIVPTVRKRWKSVTHGMPNYNFRTQQWEEGIYVTVERFIRYLFGGGPYADADTTKGNIVEKWDSLSKNQKANLKRALAGFIVQVSLILVTTLLLTKDDDDEWWSRQTRYYMLRLGTEARASAIFTDLGTVLVSPLAVISPLQRWYKVLINMIFHNGEVLQSGPYRGHTKTYGAAMRAMPIYPQIVDFIEGDKDNKRASIYEF